MLTRLTKKTELMNHAKLATANIALHLVLTIMDAIWWGDTGYVSPHFLDVGNIICYVPPSFSRRVCIWRGFKIKCYICHV